MPSSSKYNSENSDEKPYNKNKMDKPSKYDNNYKNINGYENINNTIDDYDNLSDEDAPTELLTKLRTLHHHAITINQELDTSISLLQGAEQKINQRITQITRGLKKIKDVEWSWWYVIVALLFVGVLGWILLF